jgi:hypothetical protein
MSKIKLIIVRFNNGFFNQPNSDFIKQSQMMNSNMNMNSNKLPHFGMAIIPANNASLNQMNNLQNASNQNARIYNFKQMEPNHPIAVNPRMIGNLRGTFNNNLQSNLINSSIPNQDSSQESNNTTSPANTQVNINI